jgi:hypothetical protein
MCESLNFILNSLIPFELLKICNYGRDERILLSFDDSTGSGIENKLEMINLNRRKIK